MCSCTDRCLSMARVLTFKVSLWFLGNSSFPEAPLPISSTYWFWSSHLELHRIRLISASSCQLLIDPHFSIKSFSKIFFWSKYSILFSLTFWSNILFLSKYFSASFGHTCSLRKHKSLTYPLLTRDSKQPQIPLNSLSYFENHGLCQYWLPPAKMMGKTLLTVVFLPTNVKLYCDDIKLKESTRPQCNTALKRYLTTALSWEFLHEIWLLKECYLQ